MSLIKGKEMFKSWTSDEGLKIVATKYIPHGMDHIGGNEAIIGKQQQTLMLTIFVIKIPNID